MQQKQKKSSFFTTEITQQTQRSSIKKSGSRHQNIEQEKDKAQRALQFIAKLRANKKEFDGKIHMIKRAETEKRQQEAKRKEIQAELQKEMLRKIRRLKAQANLEYYKEKNGLDHRNFSQSHSSRKRSHSALSQQSESISSPRVRLPSIYNQPGLQQIKEQQSQKVPQGIQKTMRKRAGLIKRARTEANRHNDGHEDQQKPEKASQLKLLSVNKKSALKFRLRSEEHFAQKDDNKKSYLISKNRTGDISQYLEQFTNLNLLQKISQQAKTEKKVIRFKNMLKAKKTGKANLNISLDKLDLANLEFQKQEDFDQQGAEAEQQAKQAERVIDE